MHRILFLLIPLLIFKACTLDNDEIKALTWKYGDGFSIGDFFDFTYSRYKLRNDTIFVADSAAAIIIRTDKKYLWDDTEMTIQCIRTERTGTYYAKGKIRD